MKAGSDAVGGRQLQEQAPNADLQQTAPVPASHGSVGSQASELHQGSGLLQPQPPRVGLEQGAAARGPFQRQRFRGGSLRGSMPALGSRRRPQGTALDEHQPDVTECPEPEEVCNMSTTSSSRLMLNMQLPPVLRSCVAVALHVVCLVYCGHFACMQLCKVLPASKIS